MLSIASKMNRPSESRRVSSKEGRGGPSEGSSGGEQDLAAFSLVPLRTYST